MQVEYIGYALPPEAEKDGCVALSPELMAAVAARYSRNGEGIHKILELVDKGNQDASTDRIFNLFDYGHQSIADIVPVTMFMDDISLYLAYFLWSECDVVAGQETSTRYVKMDRDGLVDPAVLGIPPEEQDRWYLMMDNAYALYEKAVAYWTEIATNDPTVMNIPNDVINDTSSKGIKLLERMRRNYVFDRSRYFLPLAAKTNVVMQMSAREWVRLVNVLLSHYLSECRSLGTLLREKLEIAAPRLVKHAKFTPETYETLWSDFMIDVEDLEDNVDFQYFLEDESLSSASAGITFEVLHLNERSDFATSNKNRTNRYSRFGEFARHSFVRFGFDPVAIAEIRDFNRHRTGDKICPMIPWGFYCAHDQRPNGDVDLKDLRFAESEADLFIEFETFGLDTMHCAREMILDKNVTYVYYTLLGHQYEFEHIVALDKFVYEAELRTGTGAHYRYAQHMSDVLRNAYAVMPELFGAVMEGTAEPE